MEKDILVHYMVYKKEKTSKPKMNIVIQSIYMYIQNHEIYFDYEPTFNNGVLLFGIVGFKKDHTKLKEELGDLLNKSDCQLKVLQNSKK